MNTHWKEKKERNDAEMSKTSQVVQTLFELKSTDTKSNKIYKIVRFQHNPLIMNRYFCQAFSVGKDNVRKHNTNTQKLTF